MRLTVEFHTKQGRKDMFVITADGYIEGVALAKITCNRAKIYFVGVRPARPDETRTLRDILEFEDIAEHDDSTIDTLIDEALLNWDRARFDELIELKQNKKRRTRR